MGREIDLLSIEEAQPTGFRNKEWKEEKMLNAQVSGLGTCVDGSITHRDDTQEEC